MLFGESGSCHTGLITLCPTPTDVFLLDLPRFEPVALQLARSLLSLSFVLSAPIASPALSALSALLVGSEALVGSFADS